VSLSAVWIEYLGLGKCCAILRKDFYKDSVPELYGHRLYKYVHIYIYIYIYIPQDIVLSCDRMTSGEIRINARIYWTFVTTSDYNLHYTRDPSC
jgi:hypothetical protein